MENQIKKHLQDILNHIPKLKEEVIELLQK